MEIINNPIARSLFDEVMVPCYDPMPLIPVRGQGSRVWDQNDNEYIDFAGGIAVSCLGHCHPSIVKALTEQASKLWHLSNLMTNEPALKLASKLTQLTFAERVFFANSGAEANEAALKLARRVAQNIHDSDKTQIIAFNQSFHGRTFFTVSVGGQPCYSDGFGAKPADIIHLDFNDIKAFEAQISNKTCAVIMEPLQGEGGIICSSSEFVQKVRQLCSKFNALLIFDEVQTGNGRTGHLYAYQGLNVIPDILTTAKSLGGGFPIGAMLTTAQLAKHLSVGVHGSTYGGNPLACAVALAVMNEISQPNVLKGVIEKEALFRTGLKLINEKYDIFCEIRGKGLLLGAALNSNWQGYAKDIVALAAKQGLFILTAANAVLRFTPSLIISNQEIQEGLAKLDQAIATLYKRASHGI